MLHLERDPAFWARIVSHPQVAHVMHGQPQDGLAALLDRENVIPLANEFGGYILIPIDVHARVLELHALITPEGWGKNAVKGAAFAAECVFEWADLVIAYRVLEWPRFRPWRSFGFEPAGEMFQAHGLHYQTWMLPKMTWQSSPARMKWV
jgi:hypothetical protein